MLEDSSFAIRPDSTKNLTKIKYFDIGSLLTLQQNESIFTFHCQHGFVSLLFYSDDIVRIIMDPSSEPSLKSSVALVKQPDPVKVQLEELDEKIIIASPKLTVELQKSPLRVCVKDKNENILVTESNLGMGYTSTNAVFCFKDMDADDHFYGFGEKTGFLDKRGEKMTMWNSDVYAPHNPETDALYQSIPYFMTIRDGKAHGIFFDNTFKTTFDFKSNNGAYSFSAEDGQLDYYILAGPSPKDVIEQYTDLTGRMPLPPKWALGYHQSKYSYKSEQEVRELVSKFAEKQIPIDAIYLDIHYMHGYRVFTFDRAAFPDPKQLIHDLKQEGIHVVPIVDPGVKQDPNYHIYKEGVLENHFCKYLEGDLYLDEVWPGISAFPDFTNTETQKWWGEKHSFYTDLGIEGIWNDMNEPAVFNKTKTMDLDVIHNNDGDLKTHHELHNIYGLLMGKATYEGMQQQLNGKRPFLLTRAGYAGIQRYAAVWTGDNRSFWEHLEMSLPMCINLGVSGVPFCGPDVGGFAHDSNGQLLTRWMQVGTFTPFFRNHNALDTVRQEPWSFGEKYEKIIKKYIHLRYQWLPHLYTLFMEASQSGIPVMRPLFLEYPNDSKTTNLSDQFLIGENALIAPIMKPDTYHRVVYLPEGDWVNYWTDKVIQGGTYILVEADLEILPIFIKKGSMIAHGAIKHSTMAPETNMEIHLYPNENEDITYTLYDDDGETFANEKGEYFLKKITCQQTGSDIQLSIKNENSSYKPNWNEWTLVIHLLKEPPKVFVNNEEITNDRLAFNKEKHTFSIKFYE
ncbi:glycoside hydrolase family 31 protein [Schinkia azotoformans]|uniref:glycoside hydrolase family 31 protein n=1 Tax=Schinkia azotoformans TaxID=1454 RepID=UPI002E1AE97E|nr:glycoside hydrolase family 31 protein [Schinkia azotoformans]